MDLSGPGIDVKLKERKKERRTKVRHVVVTNFHPLKIHVEESATHHELTD
jgi:hypothetical protein